MKLILGVVAKGYQTLKKHSSDPVAKGYLRGRFHEC
ncbi:MAG: hypothetical protein KR126chlam4_00306 [Candidatus Anoxychlamydiales bacterium]|nr:hypothetical protein [Candidatus Anoxychlamydiales bacterium]